MSMTATEVGVSQRLAHEDLVDPALWNRLVTRVQFDHEFQNFFGSRSEPEQRQWAERIMNEALGYLRLCGESVTVSYGPSLLVDIGWHTFILYTREYAAFCERIAGCYIHHEPSDQVESTRDINLIPRTIAAMQERGLAIDMEVWRGAVAARCSGHCRNTCSHGK